MKRTTNLVNKYHYLKNKFKEWGLEITALLIFFVVGSIAVIGLMIAVVYFFVDYFSYKLSYFFNNLRGKDSATEFEN